MIEWPAILKCQNDDELLFLPTEDAWLVHLNATPARSGDRLIDSRGICHVVEDAQATDAHIDAQFPVQLSLDEVLQLVRQHASVCGHCCVSKMGAPGIAQAVALVKEID